MKFFEVIDAEHTSDNEEANPFSSLYSYYLTEEKKTSETHAHTHAHTHTHTHAHTHALLHTHHTRTQYTLAHTHTHAHTRTHTHSCTHITHARSTHSRTVL